MASVQKLSAGMIEYHTLSGQKYQVPRPSLKFWRNFQKLGTLIVEIAEPESSLNDEKLDELVTYLHEWLAPYNEGLTREIVEENFDIADLMNLQAAIAKYYLEVTESLPPIILPVSPGAQAGKKTSGPQSAE